MRIKAIYIVMLIGYTLLVSSCATIMHGTTQDIGISSAPSGAIVLIDGNEVGKTPYIAKLKRGKAHIISISKAGYETADVTLTKNASGWLWGNIIFGGIIGLAVDFGTGGAYDLRPESVRCTLSKGSSSIHRNIYIGKEDIEKGNAVAFKFEGDNSYIILKPIFKDKI